MAALASRTITVRHERRRARPRRRRAGRLAADTRSRRTGSVRSSRLALADPAAVRPHAVGRVASRYAASTFGMISSFSRLRSSSVFDTGTSANGGQRSGIVSPASL